MPKLTFAHEMEVKPERFVAACSALELYELELILQRPAIQEKITTVFGDVPARDAVVVDPAQLPMFEPNKPIND
jgi:hypothetical protein